MAHGPCAVFRHPGSREPALYTQQKNFTTKLPRTDTGTGLVRKRRISIRVDMKKTLDHRCVSETPRAGYLGEEPSGVHQLIFADAVRRAENLWLGEQARVLFGFAATVCSHRRQERRDFLLVS